METSLACYSSIPPLPSLKTGGGGDGRERVNQSSLIILQGVELEIVINGDD